MPALPGFLSPRPGNPPGDLGAGLPGGQSNEIPGFTMTCQEETQWCWAAVTQAVELWGANALDQSTLASFHVDPTAPNPVCVHPLGAGTPGSRCTPCTRGCGEPHSLANVLVQRSRLAAGGAKAINALIDLHFSDIKAAIDGGKPLPFRINWPGNSGHFICVSGYMVDANGDPWVTVYDPLLPHIGAGPADSQSMRFSVFVRSYPGRDGVTGSPNFLYEVQ